MAAAGLRNELLSPRGENRGPALALTANARQTRMASDAGHPASSKAAASRLFLGLGGSCGLELGYGAVVTPKLDIGVRDDGGDSETGTGMQVRGGFSWHDPERGLALDVSGRSLVSRDDEDLEDHGYAASFAHDPDASTGRGLSLQASRETRDPTIGKPGAMFAASLGRHAAGAASAEPAWRADVAYGLRLPGDPRLTLSPFAGFVHSDASMDWNLGWRHRTFPTDSGQPGGTRAVKPGNMPSCLKRGYGGRARAASSSAPDSGHD